MYRAETKGQTRTYETAGATRSWLRFMGVPEGTAFYAVNKALADGQCTVLYQGEHIATVKRVTTWRTES